MWSSRADRAATPAAAPYRTASHRARRPFPSPTQPSDPTVSTHSLALISLALIVRASGSLKSGRIVASVRKIQDAVPTPEQTPVTDSTVEGVAVRQRLDFVTIGVRDLGTSRRSTWTAWAGSRPWTCQR